MPEDIFILIESCRLNFTAVEQVIADYHLSKQPAMTIDKLSAHLAVSKASITRFCKKIGLSNYKELVFLYKLSLNQETTDLSVSSKITAAYHSLATRSDVIIHKQSLMLFVNGCINIESFIFLVKASILTLAPISSSSFPESASMSA